MATATPEKAQRWYPGTDVHEGEVAHVTTDPDHVHVFGTETGERSSA